MGSQQRQLVLVVEGTAALGPAWPSLRAEYLDKMIRTFHGSDPAGQKVAGASGIGEMALVVFGSRGPYAGCLVQQSGWTSSLDVYFKWLSSLNFSGGGFGDVAIAEGLAEALLMCCSPSVPPVTQGVERQKHCVLVAASNPHRLATPVPCLPLTALGQQASGSEVQAEHWWLADADTVAKAFPQCLVSLSIISPRQLPILKTIYNTGKRNPRAVDSSADMLKHPQHLVLVSENFMDGRKALRRPVVANTTVAPSSTVKIEQQVQTVASPPLAGQPAILNPRASSVSAVPIAHSRQNISNGTLPAVTVKAEPSSVSSLSSVSAISHMSSASIIQNNASAVPLNIQQASVTGQDGMQPSLSAEAGNTMEFKNFGNNTLQSIWSSGLTTGTTNQLYNPTQTRQIINSAPFTGPSSLHVQGVPGLSVSSMMSVGPGLNTLTMGQGGVGVPQVGIGVPPNSGAVGIVGQGAHALSNTSFATATASFGGNSSLGLAQQNPLSNSGQSGGQALLNVGQSLNAMGQVGLSGAPLGQTGLGAVHGVMIGQATAGVNTGSCSMNPTSAIAPSVAGTQSIGTSNNPMQSNSAQSAQSLALGNNMMSAMQPLGAGNGSVQALQPQGASNNALQSMQPLGVGNSALQGMQQLGVGNNVQPLSSVVATPPQQPAGSSAKYTKLWEGTLTGSRNQKPVTICKLEGYRQISAPDTLASDWPDTMQIVRLIAQEYMNSKDYQGKAELLVFRPLTPHGFLVQLAEKKLCAVIQLPSQTLLLASADKPNRMIGMLFPGDMVVFKPQVPPQQLTHNATPTLGQNFGQGQLSSQSGQLSAQARSPMMQSANLPGSGFLS